MHIPSNVEHAAAQKPNGPLRLLSEIAAEFGVQPCVLNHIMGTAKPPPPQRWSKFPGGLVGRKSYYELNAMRAWWANYQQQKRAA